MKKEERELNTKEIHDFFKLYLKNYTYNKTIDNTQIYKKIYKKNIKLFIVFQFKNYIFLEFTPTGAEN
jgi:hypothetical protein